MREGVNVSTELIVAIVAMTGAMVLYSVAVTSIESGEPADR